MEGHDALDALLQNVYDGKVNPSDAVSAIRTRIYPALLETGDMSILRGEVEGSSRTVRGRLWSVFLALGEYDSMSFSDSIAECRARKLSSKISGELDRFLKSSYRMSYEVDEDEAKYWFHWYAGWVKHEADLEEFQQIWYLFGLIFLRNMDLVSSFQGFDHFVRPFWKRYLGTGKQLKKIMGMTGELLEYHDRELVKCLLEKNRQNEVCALMQIVSFRAISSLFTQERPTDGVEVIWDFMIVYGAHFVVYIEVAWFILNKKGIMNGKIPTAQGTESVMKAYKATDQVRKASSIFAKTDDTLKKRVYDLFYAE